jgi:hypothetical protein
VNAFRGVAVEPQGHAAVAFAAPLVDGYDRGIRRMMRWRNWIPVRDSAASRSRVIELPFPQSEAVKVRYAVAARVVIATIRGMDDGLRAPAR